MSLRRVGILLRKELIRGPGNFLFIFAIIVPLVLSLVISLLFGTLFAGKPRLGFSDNGNSQLVVLAKEIESFIVKEYDSADALQEAAEIGAVDIGIMLPADFDARLQSGDETLISSYIWGQSLLKDRAIAGFNIAALIRTVAGQEVPVEIVERVVGDVAAVSWQERLLPFVILMTIVLGGTMVPATSLVNEKQKHTLGALTITPTTLGEVLTAKGLMGAVLSVIMAIVILAINQAFGSQTPLLMLALTLSAIMAATIGVLFGVFVKDINTLFAVIKGTGLLLYAPVIVYLFPSIPEWIGRIFPTYYMIAPIVDITQNGGGFADVALNLAILTALIVLLMGVIAFAVRRVDQTAS
jgi:ABC-2 type transport system permease protein